MHPSFAHASLRPALLVLAVGLAACSRTPPAAGADPPLRPIATIQELMETQIDPAADALWDSVAFIASPSGIEDRRPRSEAEWLAVRSRALTLIEAANLLRIPGRRVKSDGSASGVGELSAQEIEQRIAASPQGFARFAEVLQDAAMRALRAIDQRNAEALMDAGGVIDEACEACHLAYWYPNQRPTGT